MSFLDNPIQQTCEQLDYFWKRRESVKALILTLLIFNFVITPILASASYSLLDKSKLFQLYADSFFIAFGISWSLLNVTIIVLWFFFRAPAMRSPGNTIVFFAPESEKECEDTIYSLYEEFKRDLDRRGLSSLVPHSLIPAGYTIRNQADADRLLAETGARLVIYGHVVKGKIANRLIEGFKSVSFTVRCQEVVGEHDVRPILETLASATVLRSFVFHEANSFIEKSVVVQNLSEVARFFVAAALSLEGKVDESLPILQTLLSEIELKRRRAQKGPQIQLFHRSIVTYLKGALLQQFNRIYESHLVEHVTSRDSDVYADQCQVIVDKLSKLVVDPNEFGLLQALLRFHFGDVIGAKKYVTDAKQFFPTDAAPYLSSAFLRLWEGSYRSSLQEYLRAKRCSEFDSRTVVNV